MATNEHGTSDPSDPMDLDRLIGELETDAARRRAEPGYPHDADARLHFELARRAPNPPGEPNVTEFIAQVQELAGAIELDALTAPRRCRRDHDDATVQAETAHRQRLDSSGHGTGPRHRRRAAARWPIDSSNSKGGSDSSSRSAMTARCPRLPPRDSGALARWRTRLAETLPRGARVLVRRGLRPTRSSPSCARDGIDAYGITTTGPRHRPGPDVRSGDLLTHLTRRRRRRARRRGAGRRARCHERARPSARWSAALGRVAAERRRHLRGAVVVASATRRRATRIWPWADRLTPTRGCTPFTGSAMVGTAEYDPTGQSYRVVVRARE